MRTISNIKFPIEQLLMMNKMLVRTAIFSLVIALQVETARAQNQPLNYSPNPIYYGQTTTYTIPNTGNTIARVAWSWQMQGNCGVSVAAKSSSSQYVVYETIPGTFVVKAIVTYSISGGRTPPSQTFQATVTVPPPDGVTAIVNNVVKPMGIRSFTQFQITCKGQPIGYLPGNAIAQECNYNFRFANRASAPGNPNVWAPTSSADPGYQFFCLNGNIIMDQRNIAFTNNNANYNNSYNLVQNGQAWMTNTQKLQILLPNGCGGFTAWPLGQGTTSLIKQPNQGYSVRFQ